MADNTNLGEYRVVVSADFAGLISSINSITNSVQQSADKIAATMNTMTETSTKGYSGIVASMKSMVDQSNQLAAVSNATSNTGKSADEAKEKYKSLQAQVTLAAKEADKAWQGGTGFTEAKGNFNDALNSLVSFKKELGTLSVGSEKGIYSGLARGVDEGSASFKVLTDRIKELNAEQQRFKESTTIPKVSNAPTTVSDVSPDRERALQEEQKLRRAIDQQQLKSYNDYISAEQKLQNSMTERERSTELANTKAYEANAVQREKALQQEQKIRMAIDNMQQKSYAKYLTDEQKLQSLMTNRERVTELSQSKQYESYVATKTKQFQQEQAEIQRLNTSYDNLYRRVASYVDTNTKLSAQSFTKMKSDMDTVTAQMGAKGATPTKASPLSGFSNYGEYVAGFENIDKSIKKASNSAQSFTNILEKMKSHVSWMATAGLVGAAIAIPMESVRVIADIEQQMAGMIQTLPQLHNNQSAVNDVSRQFIGIAQQYGMEVDKIIEAGKLWSRGYKEIGDVMSLTGLSAKLAIADMMDVTLANRAVESIINSYGKQSDAVSFATHTVDSFTNVAHNAQSSATDLAEALMRSGAAAHVVGVSFDTTTALASTMIKTTGQSGSIVGNALKSIFSSIHSDKSIQDLQNLGIAVYDFDKSGTAHFRDVSSVITDLMLTVHETSQDMQQDLEHIAGGRPKLAA